MFDPVCMLTYDFYNNFIIVFYYMYFNLNFFSWNIKENICKSISVKHQCDLHLLSCTTEINMKRETHHYMRVHRRVQPSLLMKFSSVYSNAVIGRRSKYRNLRVIVPGWVCCTKFTLVHSRRANNIHTFNIV